MSLRREITYQMDPNELPDPTPIIVLRVVLFLAFIATIFWVLASQGSMDACLTTVVVTCLLFSL